jgi:phage terminase small subunit
MRFFNQLTYKTMNEQQLSLQQQRFCDEYLVSFNAFQAALNAGYSKSTARKCELLHLPKIQAYLQQGMKKTSERLEISHDMILREFAKVAFASMGDYYDENGVAIPIQQLTADQRAAIQQYQLMDCIGDYEDRVGEISKIKLHNKMAALDKIARHTGFYLASAKPKKSDVGSQMSEVNTSPESEVVSLESDGGLNGAEVEKVLTISPPEREPRVESQESREEISNKNILTISPPDGESRVESQESREEISNKNILTISPTVNESEVGSHKSKDDDNGVTPPKGMVWAGKPGRWAAVQSVFA